MTVTIDTASRVTSIESGLPAGVTAPLTGAAAVRGFRARLASLAGLDPSSLESAFLDELPTVRLEHIDVVPHALPFGECPLAAPNAADLAGGSLRDVSGCVKEQLAGTRSCTHLNDTLRFLRYVPALAELGKNEEDR